MDQNIYPVKQGFPRPPDGGQPAPTASPHPSPVSQGFAPAPLAYPFPSVPTPPQVPFNPVTQAFKPVPVAFTLVPPALEVNVAASDPSTSGAPTFVVSEVGNLPTIPQDATVSFTIASVVDFDTGLAQDPSTVNLLITLDPASKPLNTFGAQLYGREVFFTSGAWIPPPGPFAQPLVTSPRRPLLTYGPLALVVPVKDEAGNGVAPVATNTIALNVAVGDGEVVTDLHGLVQDIVPSTDPLLTENGIVETKLPVQEVVATDQVTTIGTPVNHFPPSPSGATSAGPTQNVNVTSQTGVIGIPVNHNQSIHL